MPSKKTVRRKAAPKARKRVDKAQNARIKELEQFVYKTIENKQINYQQNVAVATAGFVNSTSFVPSLASGTYDGNTPGDPARIGDTITLMRLAVNFCFKMSDPSTGDQTNRFRAILVESTDGAEPLVLSDVLQYASYAIYGEQVFVSPYTTKASTNRNYNVLMDKVIDINQTQKFYQNVKFVKKWRGGKLLTYDGPGVSVPTNYNITLLMISDSLVLAHPSCNYSARMTYKDA